MLELFLWLRLSCVRMLEGTTHFIMKKGNKIPLLCCRRHPAELLQPLLPDCPVWRLSHGEECLQPGEGWVQGLPPAELQGSRLRAADRALPGTGAPHTPQFPPGCCKPIQQAEQIQDTELSPLSPKQPLTSVPSLENTSLEILPSWNVQIFF